MPQYYRLVQHEKTLRLKIQHKTTDARNEDYWKDFTVQVCPQDLAEARELVRQLNNPPKWIDVTEER